MTLERERHAMNAVEAEGTTLEEAISNALRQLQVERDRVEIEVLVQPSKGFLGIGGKKARIRATLRVPLSMRPSEAKIEAPRPIETPRPPVRTSEQKSEAPRPREPRVESARETGTRRAGSGRRPSGRWRSPGRAGNCGRPGWSLRG